MANPLDILRNAAGGQSRGSASSILPGFNPGVSKQLAEVKKQIAEINKIVKSGKADWKEYAKVGPLTRAYQETNKLRRAQEELLRVKAKGKQSIGEQARAYDNLIKAQKRSSEAIKEANFAMNETKGVAGRLKNVLDSAFERKEPMLLGAALKDLKIIGTSMTQSFDQLANRGQLAGMSMSQLASATAIYTGRIKLAGIQAAAVGIQTEVAEKAFARLASTYGGNAKAAKDVADSWRDLIQLSAMTGVGMESVADLAAQGYARLGESLEDVKDTVAAVGRATAEMNQRFGAAAPTATMMAKAVTDLAFAKGFHNQNTRLLVDTLSREVSMQLALGKTQEAAVANAQKNIEAAGKVNIVGITKFRDQIQANFNAAEDQSDFLAQLEKDFGAEGKLIAGMLERGELQSQDNLFAIQEMFKNSSALQEGMLETIRDAAAGGNINELLAIGIDLPSAQKYLLEARQLQQDLESILAGEEVSGINLSDEEMSKFLEDSKGMSNVERQREFRRVSAAGDQGTEGTPGEDDKTPDYKKFIDEVGIEKGAFRGITEAANVIPGLIEALPLNFATLIGGLLMNKFLGVLLKNIGGGGGGVSSAIGGAVGAAARGAAGAARAGLGVARTAATRVLAPLYGAHTLYNLKTAGDKATELFGKDASMSNIVGTFGARAANPFASDEELREMATGSHQGMATMLGDILFDLVDKDVNQGQATSKSIEDPTLPGQYDPQKMMEDIARQSGMDVSNMPIPNAGGKQLAENTPSRPGSRSASAEASISGNSLILEVNNWDSVFAQTQYDLASNE